jgi:8-oxo-dGTP pyrophosphatase MutT (NUDIX family)
MMPVGGLDAGETHEEALVREFREETGHAVTVGAFVGEAAQFTWDAVEKVHWRKVGRFYRVTLGPRAEPPTEADHTCRWLPLDEALGSMTGAFFARAFRRAVDMGNG